MRAECTHDEDPVAALVHELEHLLCVRALLEVLRGRG